MRRIRTCQFDDGNERCCGSDACEVYRDSSSSTPRSAIISTRNVISTLDTVSKPTAPLLLLSGVNSAPHKGGVDQFRIVSSDREFRFDTTFSELERQAELQTSVFNSSSEISIVSASVSGSRRISIAPGPIVPFSMQDRIRSGPFVRDWASSRLRWLSILEIVSAAGKIRRLTGSRL